MLCRTFSATLCGPSSRCSWAASRCLSVARAAAQKHRVVFLGTPQVATIPLNGLIHASRKPDADFEVVAVVSQPPRPKGRGKKTNQPSAVHQLALDEGFCPDQVLTPGKAGEEAFLAALTELKPDLCITAAYGNMLPRAFLDLPSRGTLNLHPSLLPDLRGAAPVNRALERGDRVGGVSLAFTVLKCDAGPVVAQEQVELDENEQAPEVLERLFVLGTDLLLKKLPDVWSGAAARDAKEQREEAATHAAKMSTAESWLDFSQSAEALHAKVKGFATWPGTRTEIRICSPGKDDVIREMKVIRSRLATPKEVEMAEAAKAELSSEGSPVVVTKDALLFCCGDGVLAATTVHVANKKPCSAEQFAAGTAGKSVFLKQE